MYRKHDSINIILLSIFHIAFTVTAIDRSYFSTKNKIIIQAIITTLCCLYFMYRYYQKHKIYLPIPHFFYQKILLLIWCMFSISVIISVLINHQVPLSGFFYLIIIPIVFFIIIPCALDYPLNSIINSMFFSNFIVMIFVLLLSDESIFESIAFKGIIANPNSFGIIALQSFISSGFIVYLKIVNQEKNKTIYMIGSIISLGCMLSSGSRSALLSSIIFFIPIGIVSFYRYKNTFYKWIAPVSIVISLVIFLFKDIFYNSIWLKFLSTSSHNSVLSNRNIIWNQVFINSNIFGHGEKYFLNNLGIEAHNIFVQILGYYGWISAVLLISFFSLLVVTTIIFAIKYKKNTYSLFLLSFFLCFLALGMVESIFGAFQKNPCMIFYNLVGIILFYKQYPMKRVD
ncbi:O-antigen ligase [Facklamia hominis]|uniref:O-antigen ligase family protein n=1 Tax=Facklamia hominis TaxID=178214 RepID=UPI000C7D55BF|nr:O-antigen polymerase [Facklamia hominis]PKY93792.1 hypothetical protein CYJ56_00865 [Facklamia hominis]